jgi:hypothetical protein
VLIFPWACHIFNGPKETMTELPATQQGGCLCGKVRFEVSGEPLLTYKCHCLVCQRTSGGGGIAVAWFAKGALRILSGEPAFFDLNADSGRIISRGFCRDCSAPLVGKLMAPVLAVIIPSLDDSGWYQPECEIWVSKARSWDALLPDTRKFSESFDMDFIRQRLGR